MVNLYSRPKRRITRLRTLISIDSRLFARGSPVRVYRVNEEGSPGRCSVISVDFDRCRDSTKIACPAAVRNAWAAISGSAETPGMFFFLEGNGGMSIVGLLETVVSIMSP